VQRLGYLPSKAGMTDDPIEFTDELIQEYEETNKVLLKKMNDDLARDNPEDLDRRLFQASILKKSKLGRLFRISFHNKVEEFDRDDAYASEDEYDEENDADHIDQFAEYPKGASEYGFLTDDEVAERFNIEENTEIKFDKFSINYCAASQRGYYPFEKDKSNQDAYTAGLRYDDHVMFSVFDGHGKTGDVCAGKTRDIVVRRFNEIKEENDKKTWADNVAERFMEFTAESQKMMGLGFINYKTKARKKIFQFIKDAYEEADNELHENPSIDATQSGTTATTLCIRDDGLFMVGNVGDSRLILVSEKSGKIISRELTSDHSPSNINEVKRIKRCGGIIMTSEQYDVMDDTIISYEPKRVWSKEKKEPGTAFTRSIGDTIAVKVGVTPEPDFNATRVRKFDNYFVLGSDGIFDFTSDEVIGDFVSGRDPKHACRALVGLAYKRWSHHEERTDDITVIVGQFRHYSNEETACCDIGKNAAELLKIHMEGFRHNSDVLT
jgi:serine/threonine protein phosphatase PrpC